MKTKKQVVLEWQTTRHGQYYANYKGSQIYQLNMMLYEVVKDGKWLADTKTPNEAIEFIDNM